MANRNIWGSTALACVTAISGAAVLGFAPSAEAQISDRMTENFLRLNQGQYRPWRYSNGLEKDAKAGVGLGLTGALAGGTDTNIFQDDDVEVDSLISDGFLQGELRTYLTEKNRVRIIATGSFRAHQEAQEPDQYIGRVEGQWTRFHSDGLRYGVAAEVKKENDSLVNPEGFSAVRDFEHIQYIVRPNAELRWGDSRLELAFAYRLRDFVTTPGLVELDNAFYGPSVKYRFDGIDRVSLRAGYRFRIEDYDEIPAQTVDGVDVTDGTTEEVFYHTPQVEAVIALTDAVDLSVSYGFTRKDDRFEDFESFDDHLVLVRTDLALSEELSVNASVGFQQRTFDSRPDGLGGTVEYDRLFIAVGGRYEISDRVALFGFGTMDTRDSNRVIANDFRDYDINRAIFGVSFAL